MHRALSIARTLISLLALSLVLASGPAQAQRGDPHARAARAQLRQTSRGQGPTATRARAQRVSALLGRAGTRPSPLVRRYVRTALGREIGRLVEAHEAHVRSGAASVDVEVGTAARLSASVRRARRIQADSVDDAVADRVENAVGDARYRSRVDRHETAVELETNLTPQIIDAMTTSDGTVGPILREGGREPPAFLREMANGGDPSAIELSALSRDQRVQLLRSQSRGRSFFSNRRIPGLRWSRRLANRRDDGAPRVPNATMRGVAQSGETVDVDGVLMEHVEYMGPSSVDTVDGVEIHVRQTGPASRNLHDAETIEGLLDIYEPARHQHVTARVSPGIRRGDPVDRVQLVDFYRRVNIVAELDTVLDGVPLHRVADGSVTYFDYLRGEGLATLARYLRAYARGNRRGISNSTLKMAAVGFRTGDLYDNPDLVGFEVRTLSTEGALPEHHFRLVDGVQRGLVGRRFGVPRRAIRRWYEDNVGTATGTARDAAEDRAVARLHFNRPIGDMLAAIPEGLEVPDAARTALMQNAEQNYALKLLVHDFTHDPALAGNTAVLERIRNAQQAWIFRLAQGGRSMADVAGNFVADSGLHEAFAQSIGM